MRKPFLKILPAFCLSVLLLQSQAQEQEQEACLAGVYKTEEDLVQKRVSHQVNTGQDGFEFGFLFPADLKLTIKIVTPDTTLEFEPGTVFGYEQCGWQFRYYPGGDLLAQEDFYRIEETDGLVIYSSVFVSGSEQFYSRNLSSPIRLLQLKNIEEDFADQPAFLEAVKDLKKEGVDGITDQDGKGHYAINRIYAKKVKSKKTDGASAK